MEKPWQTVIITHILYIRVSFFILDSASSVIGLFERRGKKNEVQRAGVRVETSAGQSRVRRAVVCCHHGTFRTSTGQSHAFSTVILTGKRFCHALRLGILSGD